jgi:hypothetical protein
MDKDKGYKTDTMNYVLSIEIQGPRCQGTTIVRNRKKNNGLQNYRGEIAAVSQRKRDLKTACKL